MGKTVKTVFTAIIAVVVLLMLATYIIEEFIGIVKYTPAVPSAPARPGIVADIARGETRNLVFGGYTWRVLDMQEDCALVITEGVIEMRPYHIWERDARATWETCTLRVYLNDYFYREFSAQEQAIIRETLNTNTDNQWYGTNGGSSTSDKVFLLSLDEAVKYFGDSGQLDNSRPDGVYWLDDQYNSERAATINEQSIGWWLRSPGACPDEAVYVGRHGGFFICGGPVQTAQGVRPALWIGL